MRYLRLNRKLSSRKPSGSAKARGRTGAVGIIAQNIEREAFDMGDKTPKRPPKKKKIVKKPAIEPETASLKKPPKKPKK